MISKQEAKKQKPYVRESKRKHAQQKKKKKMSLPEAIDVYTGLEDCAQLIITSWYVEWSDISTYDSVTFYWTKYLETQFEKDLQKFSKLEKLLYNIPIQGEE